METNETTKVFINEGKEWTREEIDFIQDDLTVKPEIYSEIIGRSPESIQQQIDHLKQLMIANNNTESIVKEAMAVVNQSDSSNGTAKERGYSSRRWCLKELRIVIASPSLTDSALAKQINRTSASINMIRWRLKNGDLRHYLNPSLREDNTIVCAYLPEEYTSKEKLSSNEGEPIRKLKRITIAEINFIIANLSQKYKWLCLRTGRSDGSMSNIIHRLNNGDLRHYLNPEMRDEDSVILHEGEFTPVPENEIDINHPPKKINDEGRHHKHWSDEEIILLNQHKEMTPKKLRKLYFPTRTKQAIYQKILNINLGKYDKIISSIPPQIHVVQEKKITPVKQITPVVKHDTIAKKVVKKKFSLFFGLIKWEREE